jgi:hypothetical protein
VLLVHGIGEQSRGETLVNYGEPIAEWIQQWIDGLSWPIPYDDFYKWLGSTLTSDAKSHVAGSPSVDMSAVRLGNPELEALSHQYEGDPLPALELRRVLGRVTSRLNAVAPRSRGFGGNSTTISESNYLNYIGGIATVSCRFSDNCPQNYSLSIEVANINGHIERSSWLVAEAYWADSFPIPNVAEVYVWSIIIAPWVIGSHFGSQIVHTLNALKRDSGGFLGWRRGLALLNLLVRFTILPLVIPLLAATQVVLAVILVVSFIPIESVRRYADQILRKFSAVIGDCYAFASSPVRTAMILRRVEDDMEWLAKRCKHLVIVGHSQGAAIVYLTLQSKRPENLVLVVTLGSGLWKLINLLKLKTPGLTTARYMVWLGSLASLLFMYLTVGIVFPQITWLPTVQIGGLTPQGVAGLTVIVLFLLFLWLGLGTEHDEDADLRAWASSLGARGCGWLDCFSSKDPVPGGPTFDPMATPPNNYEEFEVQNTDSMLFDHTNYMTNRDQCISRIVHEVSARAGSTIPLHELTKYDSKVVTGADYRRKRRVDQLSYLNASAIVAVAVTVWARWYQLSDLGKWLDGRLSNLHSDGWLKWAWDRLDNPHFVLGFIGFLALTLVLWLVPRCAWSFWNRFETWLFFRRVIPAISSSRVLTVWENFGLFVYIWVLVTFVFSVGYIAWLWPLRVSPLLLVTLEVIVLVVLMFLNLWILNRREVSTPTITCGPQ